MIVIYGPGLKKEVSEQEVKGRQGFRHVSHFKNLTLYLVSILSECGI